MTRAFLILALAVTLAAKCFAPPPLVTGDVPTADKQTFEWYVGESYDESESGGPDARICAGLKYEVGAPWKLSLSSP